MQPRARMRVCSLRTNQSLAIRGDQVGQPNGFGDKVAFVWKIADKLRGHLKPHEYGSVMLPTLVLFRLDAVLEPTKPAVLASAKALDLNRARPRTRS